MISLNIDLCDTRCTGQNESTHEDSTNEFDETLKTFCQQDSRQRELSMMSQSIKRMPDFVPVSASMPPTTTLVSENEPYLIHFSVSAPLVLDP